MRAPLLPLCSIAFLGVVAAAAASGCNSQPTDSVGVGVVVVAAVPPPPLSGGTLIVSADAKRAIAADSDRDLVWVVDLEGQKLERTVTLEAHDEPGRLVQDDAGLVHVALRGSGALVTFDPDTGK